VDSDVYDALYVVEKGEMVMQTDLSLKDHHLRGLSVDDKDKTSAVNINYLESLLPRPSLIFERLFSYFVDFRSPDNYSISESGGKIFLNLSKAKNLTSNAFQLGTYSRKKGLFQQNNNITINHPNTGPVSLVFVGTLKNGYTLRFNVSGTSVDVLFEKNIIKIGGSQTISTGGVDFNNKRFAIEIIFLSFVANYENTLFRFYNIEDGFYSAFSFRNFVRKLADHSSITLVPNSGGSFVEFFGRLKRRPPQPEILKLLFEKFVAEN
jgi:hypothetical protein